MPEERINDRVSELRTLVIRDTQCVKCGDWLEQWEVHPECEIWTFCLSCGEQEFYGEQAIIPM